MRWTLGAEEEEERAAADTNKVSQSDFVPSQGLHAAEVQGQGRAVAAAAGGGGAWAARTGSWPMRMRGDIFAAARRLRGLLLTTGRRLPAQLTAARHRWRGRRGGGGGAASERVAAGVAPGRGP
jgi:hypothetical protein